ncbi:MAG: addiction module protein [Bacteroidota bacterium]|nr:addiction module protein [Bacteroidota bacterium]
MKNFTITIPDNKENIFIEMMKSISFVQKIQVSNDIDISEEQKEIVRNRMQRMEDNPESCLSWEDIELKIKL